MFRFPPLRLQQRETNVDPLYHSMPSTVPAHRQPQSHSTPDSVHGSRSQPAPPPGSRFQPTPPSGSWPQLTPPPGSRFQPSPPPPTQPHQAPPPYSARPHTPFHDPSPGVHHWPYMPSPHGGMGYGPGYHGNYSMGYHDVTMPKVPSSMEVHSPYEGGREVRGPQYQRHYASQDLHRSKWDGRASGPGEWVWQVGVAGGWGKWVWRVGVTGGWGEKVWQECRMSEQGSVGPTGVQSYAAPTIIISTSLL